MGELLNRIYRAEKKYKLCGGTEIYLLNVNDVRRIIEEMYREFPDKFLFKEGCQCKL